MGQPISLSDSALTTIVQLCRSLTPEARIAFMAALADELRDEPQPLGDGTVARTARALLKSGMFAREGALERSDQQ